MGTGSASIQAAPTQQSVIDFLAAPATHGDLPVDRIDTHSAIVFLAGGRSRPLPLLGWRSRHWRATT
jgi:hypothetical protein